MIVIRATRYSPKREWWIERSGMYAYQYGWQVDVRPVERRIAGVQGWSMQHEAIAFTRLRDARAYIAREIVRLSALGHSVREGAVKR